MTKTIQELREARGESRSELAAAIGVTLDELTEWELGRAEPGLSRTQSLAAHFDVRDDQINLRPGQPPTLSDQILDAITE
jgi:transcriptional regulator with XRE-family HTH domain